MPVTTKTTNVLERGSMKESKRIADQLKRAFEGDAWHGPSLEEILDGISANQAAAKPIASAHSIWEIVLHIAAWQDVVRVRLEGQSISLPDEGDWPAVAELTDGQWKLALERLRSSYSR